MFYTSQVGERAIDDYMAYLEESDREYAKLWKEALEDKLWLKDPKLFIRMFGDKNFINRFDNQGEKRLAEVFAKKYLFEQTILENLDYELSKKEDEILDKKTNQTEDDFDRIEVPF